MDNGLFAEDTLPCCLDGAGGGLSGSGLDSREDILDVCDGLAGSTGHVFVVQTSCTQARARSGSLWSREYVVECNMWYM